MRRRRNKRNASTKLGLLFIIIILSLSGISASYAHWEEKLDINAEMTTIEYGSISGYVYLDDGDGVREPCEVIGIKDYTVTLIDTFLNQQIVNITDDDGYYIFTGLLPVTYTIQITVTSHYTATTSTSYIITLTVGEASTDNNFGLQDTTMMGWWKFDEGSGTTATDSSTNGNDGTLQNMDNSDWVTGKVCDALDFDGIDDYVSVSDDASLDMTDAITVMAWVKVNDYESGRFYTVAGKWNDRDGDYRGYLLGLSTKDTINPQPKFYISTDGVDFPSAKSSETLNTGVWYHIAGTFDGNVLKIYVNGEEKGSYSYSASINSNDQPVLIGGDRAGGGNGRYFNGVIDEVKLYSCALDDSEIWDEYQAGL